MSETENLPPRVAKLIMREIKKLATSPPDGVKFIPGEEDVLNEIYAEIDGPAETPFYGGRFRVKLVIGQDFPMVAPKGYFLTKIYHPNVSDMGEICVNALKKDWKPELGISHVLKVIWCLLLVPFPESSLNDEAGKLFMESYSEYEKKARMWTKIHALRAEGTSASKAMSVEGGAARTKKKKKTLAPKEVNAGDSGSASSGSSGTSKGKKVKKKSKAKKTLKRL